MKRTVPQWFWLLLILLFAFVTRLYRIEYPPKYVFDEVYHAITAKLIARNDPRAYEWTHGPIEPNTAIDWLHPPLAKYTQAVSILIFGENSFGWRFSSVVFGVGVIALVYVVTQLAFKNRQLSLLAAGLACFDGLLLVQSRTAMNDIHVTFFILLTLVWYLLYQQEKHYKYLLLTGVTGGLAMGTKWSGVFVVGALGLVEGVQWLKALFVHKNTKQLRLVKQKLFYLVLSFVIIPPVMYFLSYAHMFIQGKDLNHFYELHKQIWHYQTTLKATHPYQSRPWQWFLDLRPVWYYVDYVDADHIANIYAFGNPALFWFGAAAIAVTLFYLFDTRLSRELNTSEKNLLLVLFVYGVSWLPWSLSPRIMFFYHYTPAVPLMCIVLAYWLYSLWQLKLKNTPNWNQVAVGLTVLLIVAVFIVWFPQWTALPVSKNFADSVYFVPKTWK